MPADLAGMIAEHTGVSHRIRACPKILDFFSPMVENSLTLTGSYMGRPLSPVKQTMRPIQPMKVLQGAAALLKIADMLQDTLTQNPVTSSDGPKRKIPVVRSEMVALEYICRLTAHTVDDLVYVIEKQEIELTEQRRLINILRKAE